MTHFDIWNIQKEGLKDANTHVKLFILTRKVPFVEQVVGELQEVEFFPWPKTFEQDWQAFKLACEM